MKTIGLSLLLVALVGCSTEPDTTVVNAQVSWMEWPAEVVAGTPFSVRLTGYGVDCRTIYQFSVGSTIDNSAVTFEPYFVVSTQTQVCPLAVSAAGAGPVPG